MKYLRSNLISLTEMRKAALLLLSCVLLQVGNLAAKPIPETKDVAETAQSGVKISGTVVDNLGEPVIGANVSVKGTNKGTITDIDGKFMMDGVRSNGTIVVSYVGMATQELSVGGKSTFRVQLSSSDVKLEEVVVTALGMKREKKALGYSTSSVGGDALNQGASVNMLKNLQGKTTGVNITSLSSDPTASVFITVRGATSIGGMRENMLTNNSQPLYVLDGIPIGSGKINKDISVDVGNVMSRLNPNDIESVTILKGAAAGALYGADAGNGVVMITTKSGKGGKKGIGVTVSTSIMADYVYDNLKLQREYLSGSRYDMWTATGVNGWGPRPGTKYAKDQYDATGNIKPGTNGWKQWDIVNQTYYDGEVRAINHEDPLRAFLETGITNSNDAVVTGNYDKGSFRASFENMNNKGITPNSYTYRNSFMFSSNYKILPNLQISAQASYNRTYVPNKGITAGRDGRMGVMESLSGFRMDMEPMSVWKQQNTWIKGYEGRLQNTPWLTDNAPFYERTNTDNVSTNNPYYITNNMLQAYSQEELFGKLELEWKIIDPVKVMLRSGLNKTIFNFSKRIPYDNQAYKTGMFERQGNQGTSLNTDLMVNFNKKFGHFDVNAMGGWNIVYNENSKYSGRKEGMANPNVFEIPTGDASAQQSSEWTMEGRNSLYATASVGWKNMIYLDGSIRNDWFGNTRLTKAHNLYPSLSASWLASETFKMPSWWNLAKLRVGYAQVGYGNETYINADSYALDVSWGGVQLGKISGSLVDPNLRPETNVTLEGGIDLAFLDNRINVEFTYFNKDHRDQINEIPVVGSTGYKAMRANVGTVNSQGIEWALNVNPVRTKDWNWNVGVNYSSAKAKVTRMAEGFGAFWLDRQDRTFIRIAEGETVGNTYGRHEFLAVQNGKYAGQMLLSNVNGASQSTDDADNRPLLGNLNPDFTMGFTTDLRWKRFTLNAVFTLRVGGVYTSETMKLLQSSGIGMDCFTGDNSWWVGGRPEYGGHAWPDNADIPSWHTNLRATNRTNARQFNDASYLVGVYIDPRSGLNTRDVEQGDGTFTWTDGNTYPIYIQNGNDPNLTYYHPVNSPIGDTWNYAQTRTWDATNLKLREVTITYDIPPTILSKIKCQSAQVSVIGKNLFYWNPNIPIVEDPETAYSGSSGQNEGLARYTLPYIGSFGAKLTLNF